MSGLSYLFFLKVVERLIDKDIFIPCLVIRPRLSRFHDNKIFLSQQDLKTSY